MKHIPGGIYAHNFTTLIKSPKNKDDARCQCMLRLKLRGWILDLNRSLFRLLQVSFLIIFVQQMHDIHRVIHKPLRDFRPLPYSSRDGHAEREHVNRGRDTPIFWPTLQVLDMSTLGDAADVNPVIKFLPHTSNVCGRWRGRCQSFIQVPATHVARVWQELDYMIDICRVTKGGYIEHL